MRAAILAPLLITLAMGCASAEKRYEQASADESKGRWASAAEKYFDVLRRDPEFPDARRKAEETGNRAVAGFVRVAGGLESAGRFERALEEYRKTDRLLENAAVVGVVLETPHDYENRRRESWRRAADHALASADRIAAEKRWRAAADAYRTVQSRYQLDANQLDRAQAGRYRSLLGGAQAELRRRRYDHAQRLADEAMSVYGPSAPESNEARGVQFSIQEHRYEHNLDAARASAKIGRYQDAYAHVERALGVFGPDAEASAEARELRARIIERGTVRVAIAPVGTQDPLARRVPRELTREIDDILEGECLNEPPMFVALVEGRDVRRSLRDSRRGDLSPRRARKLARELRADFVVLLSIAACDYDREEQPEHCLVAARGDQQAEIRRYRGRSLAVRCDYRLVDARDGRVVADGRVGAIAKRRHTHAVIHRGNADDLLLSREEHSWFDERRLGKIDREIEREIAQALAQGVAEAVLEEVTKRLP